MAAQPPEASPAAPRTGGPQPDPARNAAICFMADGYDPARGLNGRRVAGESFIRGFFRHADVAEFVSLAQNSDDQALFARLAGQERPGHPLRHVPARATSQMAPLGTISFPGPNLGPETWRRAPHGQAAWSVCGITHTTSTKAVMQGFFDMRMAAQAEWDAVICTSRAVLSSVLTQFELIDEHIRHRLGGTPPPRPQLPVIPLGVDCDAFAPDPAAGAALRARLGVTPQDVVFCTIARLTPFEKFDPLPLFIALQAAQGHLQGVRLHLVLCGTYRDDYSRAVFERGAAGLMPSVALHVLDGTDAAERKALLSGGDVFVFPIDNIQETFGLAPVEAMAAGLPVLVSDWDGMRDTVTPDVGIRIPTRTLGPEHAEAEGFRHLTGADSYIQYTALTSAMTEIDLGRLAEAILALAANSGLRARLGQAGRARARALYDWSQVVPRMQDLWAELALRRGAALRNPAIARGALPVAPSPFALFGAWPTQRGGFARERFIARPLAGRPDVAATLALRNYPGMGRQTESSADIIRLHAALAACGAAGADRQALCEALSLAPLTADRILIWLLKYGFIRLV